MGKPVRIVPAGGSLIRYRADENLDLIFREFINAEPNAAGVLGFINRFGLLTEGGHEEKGESVAYVVTVKNAMTEMVDLFAAMESGERMAAAEKLLGADGMKMQNLEVRIVFDQRTMTPKTRILAKDLFTALWLRTIELFASDTILRRCAHCNALFTAGIGTDRRLDAKFCSDEHRVLFHRLKNAPPAEPDAAADRPRRRGRPRRAAA